MLKTEIAQLEQLAELDDLLTRLAAWSEATPPAAGFTWEPAVRSRSTIKRLLKRTDFLRLRLETPLVVATFGGTGTGKSTLVNALVGADVTAAGRQRPTTRQPILLAHPDTDLPVLGLPLADFRVVLHDTPLLREIVLIDSPDPDTNEESSPGNNLDRLRALLPACDVLICTSTQQKYRSARVLDELNQAAAGCRLVFVQTHADQDSDIRSDWQRQLAGRYEVPDLFFVDSVQALAAQQRGERPGGEFGRLLDLLQHELAASRRFRIRRVNLLDLVGEALAHCRTRMETARPAVVELQHSLQQTQAGLMSERARRLAIDLKQSHQLWERRLLDTITQRWGLSPFASLLRLYQSQAALLASWTLLRARSTAGVAILGAAEGLRRLTAWGSDTAQQSQLSQALAAAISPEQARQSQLVLAGYARSAGLIGGEITTPPAEVLAEVEQEFLAAAAERVDQLVERTVAAQAGWFTRWWFELLSLSYPAFVLYRMGKNFFVDSFWYGQELLGTNFYIPAGIFLVLWAGGLIWAFLRRLRRGVDAEIGRLIEEIGQLPSSRSLWPELETTCQQALHDVTVIDGLEQWAKTARGAMDSELRLGVRLNDSRSPRANEPSTMPNATSRGTGGVRLATAGQTASDS